MNCCDYDCHQGRDCPARSTPTAANLMSHTTFTTHGHTVAVTGPQASALAKRIRCAEQAHQASLIRQREEQLDSSPYITSKRQSRHILRKPWAIATYLTAGAWLSAWLLVSTVLPFSAGFFSG